MERLFRTLDKKSFGAPRQSSVTEKPTLSIDSVHFYSYSRAHQSAPYRSLAAPNCLLFTERRLRSQYPCLRAIAGGSRVGSCTESWEQT
jgi:hypothetical protein